MRATPAAWIALAIGAVVFAVAYADGGYSLASRGTLALAVWWAILLGVATGVWPLGRLTRAAAIPGALLAGFAAWDLASTAWAASAEDAFAEFDRTALYLGVYVLVVLAADPRRLGAWLDGLALAIGAIGLVALVSRLFPGSFPGRGLPAFLPNATTRLSFPLDYWNGLGIFVALAFPLLLRSALEPGRVRRALAIGAMPALGAVVYLTSSRGAVLAALAGTVVFVVAQPRRWAALGAALAGGVGAAVAVGVLASRHALVNGPLGSAAARREGWEAALALLVVCAATAAAFELVAPRLPAPGRWARRIGLAAIAVAAVAAVFAAVHGLRDFTRPPGTGGTVGTHLASGGSSGRWQFWTAAVDEFRSSPLHGRGAGSFATWWNAHAPFAYTIRNAHSLYLETLGELGIVGFALLVGALAAGVAVGVRRLGAARGAERTALAALLGTLAAFLLGAGLDWMWELTAVTLVGVVALGLLAGSPRPRTAGASTRARGRGRRRRVRPPRGRDDPAPRGRRGAPQPGRRPRRTPRRRADARGRRDEARAVGSVAVPPARARRGASGTPRRGGGRDPPRRPPRRRRLAAVVRRGAHRGPARRPRRRRPQPRPCAGARPALAALLTKPLNTGGIVRRLTGYGEAVVGADSPPGVGLRLEHAVDKELVHAEPAHATTFVADAPAREGRPRTSHDPMRRRMLALADVGAAVAVTASLAILGPGATTAAWAVLYLPVWILAAKVYGLYDRDHRSLRHLTVDEVPTVLLWGITCVAGLALFLAVTPPAGIGTSSTAVRAFGIAVLAALALRSLARVAWRRLTPPERVVIVGDGALAHSIRRKLELFSDIHATVVGEPDDVTRESLRDGLLSEADRLIVALQSLDERLIAELVAFCRHEHVKLSIVPPARGIFGTAVQLRHIADLPVVEYNTWDVSRSTLLLKRTLDLIVASVALLLTAPIFLVTVLAIRLSDPGPAFYTQVRAGLGGREFRMFKFRTMRADAEAVLPSLVTFDTLSEPVFKLVRDPRVTPIGRFLRRTSLDELPQLLNVLKGDMSLVGPRPEQVELVRRYRPEHLFRLAVKPGLTGPMQVFGRGRLSFEERLAVEREYIENLSISRDLRILALTIPSVFDGRGAY